MLKSFSNTMEFEGKLEQRFGKSQEQDASSKFYKIISSCFAPYLDHYIDSENRSLGEMMEKYKSTPISTNITAGSDDEGLIPSSTDLFYSYRQTMIQFARFSTGKPFLDLSRMFGKWLREYANYLTLKLPRDDRRSFSDEDIRLVCFIINTADYCGNTITQLEEKISEKINAQFKNLVNMNNEREEFIGIIGNSIKILVRGVINCIDPALYNMTRLSWSAVESVGDQSDYVSNIASQLMAQGAVVKATLSGTKFYRTFCDKLADEFLAKFDGNIYKCKPVGEVGAEQMLLDTHALRTLLVQVSAIGTDRHTQPPAMFVYIT